MAFASYGIITPVLSVVLSVYMLGLALGSWAGGRCISWLSNKSGRSPLFFYGVAEGIIGLGAFAAPQLLKTGKHVLLFTGQMDSTTYLLFSALGLTVAILPWCIFMGATFPFMMAHVRETNSGEQQSFSFLYTANVLGAMLGCILTAAVLVETLGFARTLWAAAAGNFWIAISAILLAAKLRSDRPAASATSSPQVSESEPAPTNAPSRALNWILFTTGFASMAMEVVWTRAFAPTLKTQVYSFAFIVFVYLAATFAGSCIYRLRRSAIKGNPTALLLAALVISAFLPIMANDPRTQTLVPNGAVVDLKSAAILLGSICPFCAILGFLTPSLIDRESGGNPRRAGLAYAYNILGCILGPLFASYILLPYFRESHALLILAAPLFLVFLLNWSDLPAIWRVASCLGVAASFAWSVFFARDFEGYITDIWKGYSDTRRDFTASVIAYGNSVESKGILVNGIGMTTLTPITKFMVHLPLALHQGPSQSALIICFGMGTSFRSALSWDLDTTAVELVPSVPKEFGYFHTNAAEVLRNPKGRIVVDDGRRFLERTDALYDLIVIDPPPPVQAAGSSLLYSTGFYVAAKRHLKEHGLLETWFPFGDPLTSLAIYRSLRESFPYVRCFQGVAGWGIHFVASMEPIDLPDAGQLASRLPAAAKADLLEWSPQADLTGYIAKVVTHEYGAPDLASSDPDIVITDDHPFNEYFLLRSLHWIHFEGSQ